MRLLLCAILGPAHSRLPPSPPLASRISISIALRIAIYTDDFGELKRYREADAALASPTPKENRVVFLGDSITDYWKLADYFPGQPYINRGVDGQTTPQMLARFRQDAIDLHPKVFGSCSPAPRHRRRHRTARNEDIEANYASMAELARVHQIRLAFAVSPASAQLHTGGEGVFCPAST